MNDSHDREGVCTAGHTSQPRGHRDRPWRASPRLVAVLAAALPLGAACGQGPKQPPPNGEYLKPASTDRRAVAYHDGKDAEGHDISEPGVEPGCRHPNGELLSGRLTPQPEFTFQLHNTRYVNAGPDQTGELNEASPVWSAAEMTGPDAWRVGTLKHWQEMVNAGTLGPTAELQIAYYLHHNDCTIDPLPRLKLYVNGTWVSEVWDTVPQPLADPMGRRNGYLVAPPPADAGWVQNRWNLATIHVPIQMIRFPAARGSGGNLPIAAVNNIRIAWDDDHPGWGGVVNNCYCLAVDWASLEFKAMAPVVLMHGINQTDAWWSRHGFKQELDAHWIPKQILDLDKIGGTGSDLKAQTIWTVAAPLGDRFKQVYSDWGTAQLHVVAHSKGGLHVRHMLATRFSELCAAAAAASGGQPDKGPVPSFTTLSTPHNGSVLADILVTGWAYKQGLVGALHWSDSIPATIDVLSRHRQVYPGYETLQTPACSLANARHFGSPDGVRLSGRLPGPSETQYFFHGADMDLDHNDAITVGFYPFYPAEIDPLQKDEPQLVGLLLVPNLGLTAEQALTDMYLTLKYNRTITVNRSTVTRPNGQVITALSGFGVAPSSPQGNDILVTIPSAFALPAGDVVQPIRQPWQHLPSEATTPGKNHSSIGDGDVAAFVIPDLLTSDRIRGGMRP